jgi:hypothetical protein
MSSRIEAYSKETSEILLINPLCPPILGDFEAGGHPQTPGRKYPAPLFQQFLSQSLFLLDTKELGIEAFGTLFLVFYFR